MKLPARLLLSALLALCVARAPAQAPPQGDTNRGKQIFASYGCYQCHGYQGQGSNAGSRIAPDPLPFPAFAFFVRQPRARMPPYSAKILTDQDMADIYAYLMTIPKARDVADIPLLAAPRQASVRE